MRLERVEEDLFNEFNNGFGRKNIGFLFYLFI